MNINNFLKSIEEQKKKEEQEYQEYLKHEVFNKINEYKKFYNSFEGDSIMTESLLSTGIFGFYDNIFISIVSTLESIDILLRKKHTGDAIVLLRKYYDASIISIYICLICEKSVNNSCNSK